MLFLTFVENDFGRLMAIYVSQSLVSAIFLFLALSILKRNRNRLTLLLSGFYILAAIGFIFNAIYIHLEPYHIAYIIYIIAAFLILFCPIFLVFFIINLLRIEPKFSWKKQIIFILSYGVLTFLLLNFPGGFTLIENNYWSPVYSWTFSITIYIVITCVIVIPFVTLFFKLYKTFEDEKLKKRLKYFFMAFCWISIGFYGLILFNTWKEPLFRTIWGTIVIIIAITSGGLIYYTWVYKL